MSSMQIKFFTASYLRKFYDLQHVLQLRSWLICIMIFLTDLTDIDWDFLQSLSLQTT